MFGLDAFLSTLGPASALNVASTAFNIFGGSKQYGQQAAMYDYEADKAREGARIDRELGEVQAGRMRKAGKSDLSKANADYAGSGVDVSSGSAQEVGGELSRRIELDALSAMLQGRYRGYASDVKAGQYEAAATNSRNARGFSFGSSLLGGLTREAQISGWGKKASGGGWLDAGSGGLGSIG